MYVFLAKHGALRSGEITKLIKMDKAEVYRVLTNLQTKGLVEKTLESPTRFIPTSFERAIDSFIKYKRDEANLVERTKKDLIRDWNQITKTRQTLPFERFVVIEGRHKVYSKISQMMTETKNQLSTITTVTGLLRADQFGLYDAASKHPLKSQIDFRFLTEISSKNLNGMKTILKKMSRMGFSFKGRNPDLGLSLFPRMVIRDNEETLFFITPRTAASTEELDQLCLWTNCKDLVQAFSSVFEDLWLKATDIQRKIDEVETGKPTAQTLVIENAELAKKKYESILISAKNEVFMITSSEGLTNLWKNMEQPKEDAKRPIVKIMAPITNENLEAALQLSKYYEVKHTPHSYLATTIIDSKHLFQFQTPFSYEPATEKLRQFEKTIYSNTDEYVEKTRNLLLDIWKNAQPPSAITLEPATWTNKPPTSFDNPLFKTIKKMHATSITKEDEKFSEQVTEKDVINKIIKAQKTSAVNESKETVTIYTSNGQALIHPPSHLNLPDILFHVYHIEKHSTFGAEDAIMIHLWLDTPVGYSYVPAALITDNPESVDFWKRACALTQAASNVQLLNKNELEVYVHANTFFAAWTVHLQLSTFSIPPSCLLIEGYGKIKTLAYDMVVPSGYKLKNEGNIMDAFVTFLHPSSKYSGPGTDGCFARDVIIEFHPP